MGKRKFTDYLSIIFKWKKFIIINLIVVSVIATIISFILPQKYKANTIIMVTENNNSMGALGGMLNNVGSILGGALSGNTGTPMDKIFGYLDSRKILMKVIKKFNLVEYYEIKNFKRDKTLKRFKEDISFELTENGFIDISVINKDPRMSAEIANYFVEILDSLNFEFSLAYAKSYREFIEKRYEENLNDLANAENDMEKFQEDTGIYSVPDQLKIAFEAIARMESELALKEMERDYIAKTDGTQSSRYFLTQNQVELIKEKLASMKKDGSVANKSITDLSFEKLPLRQKQYLRLYRQIEVQSKLLEFILPMYEQAVMEEQKNIPTIVVLDRAIIPQLKDSPKKAFIILTAFSLTLFTLIIIVFQGEAIISSTNSLNIIEIKEKKFFSAVLKLYKIKLD
ncbi:MAG: hypothetical protein GXX85_16125 [Ignavibacteria bacterium]|nr:hypothetical protein [Ignavibacteria bacterium]